MSLYRGAGGASDATDDSTVNAVAGYASSAASSASSAATSATAADASASAASTSASSAASSASGVAANATNAASSASLASTYAASASNSKDAAAASAVIASDKAGLASSSESNAAASAATATTKAGEASSSASSAATSAFNAASSASSALAIYGNTAAMNAAVASAAASASTSSTQAGLSAASAADSSASSDLAYEHELNAAEWASFAQGSANNAQSYATSALSARDATLAAYDSFDDRYLGVKSANPTTDNDGNPLIAGSLYFNDQTNMMMLRAGGFWVAAYTSGGSPSFGNTVVNGTLNVTGTITGNLTGNVTGNVSGNAGTVTNGVYTTGAQTIAGVKTLSSDPILSAGTANGVPYLNGSKVLTSGSALTFDGTNLTNAQTNGSPTGLILGNSSTSTSAGTRVAFQYNGVTTGYVGNQFDGVDFNNQYNANRAHIYTTGASEQMRLTGTGLGIGTSSPASKLHVVGASLLDPSGTTGLQTAVIANTGNNNHLVIKSASVNSYGLRISANAADDVASISNYYSAALTFGTANTERMRLDSSGNLGVGVSSPGVRLEVGGESYVQATFRSSATGTSPGDAKINLIGTRNTANTSLGGVNFSNQTTGSTVIAAQIIAYSVDASTGSGGYLTLSTQPVAGSVTERMRIDSSGNVGIGTSSPQQKLDVNGNIVGGINAYVGVRRSDGAVVSTLSNVGDSETRITAAGGGSFVSIHVNSSERLRVNDSGNLGLGVTPSAASLKTIQGPADFTLASQGGGIYVANNAYYNAGWLYATTGTATRYAQDTGIHKWFTAPSGTAGAAISFTQAMTLDASGNLLVGGTTSGTRLTVTSSGNADVISAIVPSASSGSKFIKFAVGGALGTEVGSVSYNGSTGVNYNTSSDYRLKNITGPVTNSGAYIDSLNPVEGTWKADGSTFVGLIAHEVQEASRTQVATGVKDGEQMQAMDYSNAELIANLIAELKSLRQRLAAAGI